MEKCYVPYTYIFTRAALEEGISVARGSKSWRNPMENNVNVI